jgi:hypothetical protein
MREKSRKSEDEICRNLGSGKISKSQEKKNLGIIEGEKSWNLRRIKISES